MDSACPPRLLLAQHAQALLQWLNQVLEQQGAPGQATKKQLYNIVSMVRLHGLQGLKCQGNMMQILNAVWHYSHELCDGCLLAEHRLCAAGGAVCITAGVQRVGHRHPGKVSSNVHLYIGSTAPGRLRGMHDLLAQRKCDHVHGCPPGLKFIALHCTALQGARERQWQPAWRLHTGPERAGRGPPAAEHPGAAGAE